MIERSVPPSGHADRMKNPGVRTAKSNTPRALSKLSLRQRPQNKQIIFKEHLNPIHDLVGASFLSFGEVNVLHGGLNTLMTEQTF